MTRHFYQKAALIFAASLLLMFFVGAPAAAQADDSAAKADMQKEEVVYANLKATGEVGEIYVVNILNVRKAGTVADYGWYLAVKNLTNTLTLAHGDGMVTADLPAGNFYYQGTLDGADLPWVISIAYYLDGRRLAPAELAGRSGRLQIALSTAANPKVDKSFYDNYILQISLYLDADRCSNIRADGATIANAGGSKLLNYTVMPGKDADIDVSADVTDFSMKGIEMSAVPFSMPFQTPDASELTDDMTLLSDAISDLYEGIGELKNGVWKLKDGSEDLKSGSAGFKKGLNDLNAGSASVVSGSSQIKDGLAAMLASLTGSSGGFSLGSLVSLPGSLRSLATGLNDISSGLTLLKGNFAAAYTALNTAMSAIPGHTITAADLAPLYADSPGSSALIDRLYETYAAAMAAKATYDAVKPAFAAVESNIDTMTGSIGTISGTLSAMADGIEAGLAAGGVDTAIAALTSGVSDLLTNYNTFHQGLVAYTGGVSSLAANYSALNTGIAGMSDGAGSLYSGVRELYDGTGELNTAVADMPGQIELKIDEWLDDYDMSDFEPVSFTSPRNNTEMVQFVFKTEKIEKPVEPQAPEPEEKENFWTRFMDLFR